MFAYGYNGMVLTFYILQFRFILNKEIPSFLSLISKKNANFHLELKNNQH